MLHYEKSSYNIEPSGTRKSVGKGNSELNAQTKKREREREMKNHDQVGTGGGKKKQENCAFSRRLQTIQKVLTKAGIVHNRDASAIGS